MIINKMLLYSEPLCLICFAEPIRRISLSACVCVSLTHPLSASMSFMLFISSGSTALLHVILDSLQFSVAFFLLHSLALSRSCVRSHLRWAWGCLIPKIDFSHFSRSLYLPLVASLNSMECVFFFVAIHSLCLVYIHKSLSQVSAFIAFVSPHPIIFITHRETIPRKFINKIADYLFI